MLINTSARDTVCANKRGRERKRERVRERRKDIEWERDSVLSGNKCCTGIS